ncbi:MAG TPA: hypothetical protein VEX43_08610 [Chthoniobacterales bacterium]|nr:hypothetical protein [Chthoniobacterales bacterium]
MILITALAANAQTAPAKLNPAEEWVIEQVKAGKIADLSEKFPNKEDRKLGATFLEDLLTGGKPNRKGVRLSGAIIDEEIDLTNAQILFEVRLQKCEFRRSATFVRANFTSSVSFNSSLFKRGADFNSMKVGDSAFFRTTGFEGPADFSWTEIAGNFEADWAQFNENAEASFNSMKVGGAASFEKAVFEGRVDFSWSHILGTFDAEGTKFKNKETVANFNSMKVGHNAFFREAVFVAPAAFSGAEIIGQFDVQKAHFGNEKEGASFNTMKIGSAFFQNAEFKGPVDFRFVDVNWISLSSVSWPRNGRWLDMTGMTYEYIRADAPGLQPHDALLKLIDQSPFSPAVYGNLEAFFLRQGYRAYADQAFIAGKRRERREHLSGFELVASWLLDQVVRYGRQPSRAGVFCAFFVAFGAALFSPKRMELQQVQTTPRTFNRFWYSLGLFLPVVNLESDKVWKPKPDQTFLRNYMRVHILLGWILVPLVLAALTGLIK